MGALPGIEVAAYLHAAGFGASNNVLRTAVAIAKAESGWDASRRGGPNQDGTYDHGLMQVNDVHKPTPEQKSDPEANARMAFAIYRQAGNSFRPWSAYNNGAYKKHMNAARRAVMDLQMRPNFERELLAGKRPKTPGDLPFRNPGAPELPNLPDNPATALAKTLANLGGNLASVMVALAFIVLGVVILLKPVAVKVAREAKGIL